MQEEEWVMLGAFIWLSAYVVFFSVACVLIQKRSSMPRLLIFAGTLMLLLVNIAFLAEYMDITNMRYNPMFEDSTFAGMGLTETYPEWQRVYWWTVSGMDFFGKILAGAGMIIEARRLTTAYRFSEMQKYQPQMPVVQPPTHQNPPPPQAL